MKSDNKQNTVPNHIANPFSNPLISTKLTQSSTSPFQTKIQPKSTDPPTFRSTSPTATTSTRMPICGKHSKPFSHLFCVECLSYNICRTCISATHTEHEVMQFSSQEELINETKQILLQNLEQTLKHLKSKENQVKNRTHEINLIRNSVRTLEQDMIATVSTLFRDIETQLIGEVEKNHQQFNQQVQGFFRAFNEINDQLRDNLMVILDGKIDVVGFAKDMIKREAPELPNFHGYKNFLQKHKKIFKDIKTELTKIKTTIFSKNSQLLHQTNSKSNPTVLSKFDKYIETGNNKGQKVNESFMKTLKLIEMTNNVNVHRKQNKGKGNKIF